MDTSDAVIMVTAGTGRPDSMVVKRTVAPPDPGDIPPMESASPSRMHGAGVTHQDRNRWARIADQGVRAGGVLENLLVQSPHCTGRDT